MKDYGPETFGLLNAEDYDALHDPGTTEESVALLAELIGSGKALEFAIGTGRVAVPLAHQGKSVAGIDASEEMIAKMREKPGGADIPAVIGDMATAQIEGPFDFAYLIFNTICNLIRQEDQVACFQNAADHLKEGGHFLVETFVPDMTRFHGNQSVRARSVDFNNAAIEIAVHDPVTQNLQMQILRFRKDGYRMTPLPIRYVWPQELDLMARLAGMTLEHRWGGWQKEPFTGKSEMHVSLYRKEG